MHKVVRFAPESNFLLQERANFLLAMQLKALSYAVGIPLVQGEPAERGIIVRTFTNIYRTAGVVALISWAATAYAADDTARFYGTWDSTVSYNGQMVTIVSIHDASGYKNYVRLPTGDAPAGDGTFSAANGKWSSNAAAPNNGGVYHFISKDIVVATNAIGQTVTWKREKEVATGPVDGNTAARRTTGYIPPSERPGNSTTPTSRTGAIPRTDPQCPGGS